MPLSGVAKLVQDKSCYSGVAELALRKKRRKTLMELPMRLALGQFNRLDDEERLLFIKQLGVDDIILNTPALPGETHWESSDLLAWRTKAEEAGLRLGAIENVPTNFYDKVMLGLPGRDKP